MVFNLKFVKKLLFTSVFITYETVRVRNACYASRDFCVHKQKVNPRSYAEGSR